MKSSYEIGNRSSVQTLSKPELENKLKQLYAKHGQTEDSIEIAQTLFEIGTIETDPDTAIAYLSNALIMFRTIYSEEDVDEHVHIAQTLYRLGEVQLTKQDYANARNSCEQAWEMYKNLDDSIHLETMSRVLDMLKEICRAQGDFNSALNYASESTDALRALIPTIAHAHTPGTETEEEHNDTTAQVITSPYPTGQSSSHLSTSSDRATPPKSNSCLDILYDCFGLFRTRTDATSATSSPDVIASPVHDIRR